MMPGVARLWILKMLARRQRLLTRRAAHMDVRRLQPSRAAIAFACTGIRRAAAR
jgi:hypothetical protein